MLRSNPLSVRLSGVLSRSIANSLTPDLMKSCCRSVQIEISQLKLDIAVLL